MLPCNEWIYSMICVFNAQCFYANHSIIQTFATQGIHSFEQNHVYYSFLGLISSKHPTFQHSSTTICYLIQLKSKWNYDENSVSHPSEIQFKYVQKNRKHHKLESHF